MHDPLWVFAYGSLMWRPGFAFADKRHARLAGYRRCFCIYSTHHRGDAARPGMVLGLDRGGVCDGIAYRIAPADAAATLAYLSAREQVNGVYREASLAIELAGEHRADTRALAYVVERSHPSYAGQLPLLRQAELIRGAKGISGANLDYLFNTVEHLRQLDIRESDLERLLAIIGPVLGRHPPCTADGSRAASRAALAACRGRAVPVKRLRPEERRRFTYRKQLAAWATVHPSGGA